MAHRSCRFAFIDALRGLAAVSVMVFHFYACTDGRQILDGTVPTFIDILLTHGWLGVECFFVISGFVIAYSLREAQVNWSFLGNFVLRRSVRLDPPYWIAILLVVTLSWASNFIMTDRLAPLPVWLHVLAHLFYSQELLGFDHIVPVFWTLCLEFQFYLVFCLLLWPAQIVQRRLKQPFATPQSQIGKLILFAPLSLLALCWPLGLLHAKLHGLFLPTWYMFLLGAFAFWALVDRRVRIWFMVMVLVLAGSYLWTRRIEVFVAATTAFAIWYAGNRDRLYRWLNYSWLQYLGGLSYSIYLLHGIIGTRALNLGNRLAPNSVAGYLFWLVVAVAVTLLSAHVLYVYVERPCVRLAQGLKVLQCKPSESLWSGLGQRIRKKPSGQNATAG